MSTTRQCGFCEEGDLQLVGEQELRGGGREGEWQCQACGLRVKLLSPGGRLTLGALALAMTAGIPYAAVTEKVARESERPWIVLMIAALALALIALFVQDTRRQKRHPLRAAGDHGAPRGG